MWNISWKLIDVRSLIKEKLWILNVLYVYSELKSPEDIRINHINTVNILISPGGLFAWRLIRGWGLICMEKDLHGGLLESGIIRWGFNRRFTVRPPNTRQQIFYCLIEQDRIYCAQVGPKLKPIPRNTGGWWHDQSCGCIRK